MSPWHKNSKPLPLSLSLDRSKQKSTLWSEQSRATPEISAFEFVFSTAEWPNPPYPITNKTTKKISLSLSLHLQNLHFLAAFSLPFEPPFSSSNHEMKLLLLSPTTLLHHKSSSSTRLLKLWYTTTNSLSFSWKIVSWFFYLCVFSPKISKLFCR